MGRAWTGSPGLRAPGPMLPTHPTPVPVPPAQCLRPTRVPSPHPPSRRGRPSQMPPSTNRGHRSRLEQDVGLRLELVLPRSRLVEAVLQVDRAVAGRGLEEHADRPRCPPQMVRHGLVPHEHLAAATTAAAASRPAWQRPAPCPGPWVASKPPSLRSFSTPHPASDPAPSFHFGLWVAICASPGPAAAAAPRPRP